jgi:hypothetical protein
MNSYATLLAHTATPACRRTLYSAFHYSSLLRCFCEAFGLLTRSIKNLFSGYRSARALKRHSNGELAASTYR